MPPPLTEDEVQRRARFIFAFARRQHRPGLIADPEDVAQEGVLAWLADRAEGGNGYHVVTRAMSRARRVAAPEHACEEDVREAAVEVPAEASDVDAVLDRREVLASALARLKRARGGHRMHLVIVLRYGLDGHDRHTLAEVAKFFQRSAARIQAIEKCALNKLEPLLLPLLPSPGKAPASPAVAPSALPSPRKPFPRTKRAGKAHSALGAPRYETATRIETCRCVWCAEGPMSLVSMLRHLAADCPAIGRAGGLARQTSAASADRLH